MKRLANGWLWMGAACWGLVLPLVLVHAGGDLMAAAGDKESRDESAAASVGQVPQRQRLQQTRLELRLSALAKALDLDATQQTQLRRILEWQRQQVRRVWNDPSVPPDYRVTMVHAISDKTAEQIRGLLREEQKAKYKLPRQPHPAAESDVQSSLEDWMNAMKPK